MDDLISRKALDDAFTELRWNEDGTLNHFGDRPDWCMHGSEVDKLIQNAPSVPAVPLDRLCEWLAEHYGAPCQLSEIDCYPQCEPDENGECYGMRTDDKKCWHDYLTKWMEGQDAKKET